jgi:outer membrane protein assembly factor BamD (BamD/ComL family)
MKKRLILLVAMTALAWLGATGCSNNNIDTAKVRAAFPSLAGEPKDQLDKGLADIDASNYVAAVRSLEKVAFAVKMDANQRKILLDAIAKANAKAAHQK